MQSRYLRLGSGRGLVVSRLNSPKPRLSPDSTATGARRARPPGPRRPRFVARARYASESGSNIGSPSWHGPGAAHV